MLLTQVQQPLPSSSELLSEAVVPVFELLIRSSFGVYLVPQPLYAETRSRDRSVKSLNFFSHSSYRGLVVG